MELTQEEYSERIAVLRRLKTLLLNEKAKFLEYLNVLEKQETSISRENTEELIQHAELEVRIVKSLQILDKVIEPIMEMYGSNFPLYELEDRCTVQEMQNELNLLRNKVLEQNKINRELLRSRISRIRTQLDNFKNPYNGIRSIYAHTLSNGELLTVDI